MFSGGNVRWGWLKASYIWTIVIAGAVGLGGIIVPDEVKELFYTAADPVTWGIEASIFLAFGVLAALGLWQPLKFAPVLLLQLIYKSVWFVGVILPLAIRGIPLPHRAPTLVIFALTIVIDLIAVPFRWIFTAEPAG